MSNITNKKMQALEACEKVINGVEDGVISVSSALCAKKFFDDIVDANKNKFSDLKFVVLGPTPAKISKINNNYRYRLALKCKNSARIRTMITKILKTNAKIKDNKGITIAVELNPNDIS